MIYFLYLFSDAHVTFTKNWDVDIINQFIETRNEMAVLSTYLVRCEIKFILLKGDRKAPN